MLIKYNKWAQYVVYSGGNGWGAPRIELKFPNGYSASIFIYCTQSDGTIVYEGAVKLGDKCCYTTPITDDVVRLYDEELESFIQAVFDLSPIHLTLELHQMLTGESK